MDQGPPDNKRLRRSTATSWSAASHNRVSSLLHHPTSPTAAQHQHISSPGAPPPPPAWHSQPSSYPRPSMDHPHPHPHTHPHPPPPPPPPSSTAPANHIDDRRQHDPDRYRPVQDHRHPPPSPVHAAPYPGYPLREPIVKPDPGVDDALPHMRRPHSTGNSSDTMVGAPHSNLPPPPHPEDRRRMSYDAGPQGRMYGQPSYPGPPQTPMSHGSPYEYGSYGPSHVDLPYATIPITSSSNAKRKAQRASQACDSCRQLKAKCDETKPCKSCREKKLECKYRESAPKAQDKVASDILDGIIRLQSFFSKFDKRMIKVERALYKAGLNLEMPMDSGGIPVRDDESTHRPTSADSSERMDEDASSSSGELNPGPEAAAEAEAPGPIGALEARRITRQIFDDDDKEVVPGPPVNPGTLAIPPGHTTLAALLLKWTPIRNIVQHHLDRHNVKYIEEFPIRQEEKRGLLRLFGRGEGQDSGRGDKEAILEQGATEGSEDYLSDTGAPSPADCWGAVGGLTPPSTIDNRGTVIVPILDFSEVNVWKFVRSYEDNIQNMHPLIVPQELHAMVRVFLDNLQQTSGGQTKPGSIAKFVSPLSSQPMDPTSNLKRKRQSPVPEGVGIADIPTSAPKSGKPVFQRSVQNALVLLVLALGKICLWKDKKLPDVVPVSDVQGSPQVRNGLPQSPSQGSPPSYPHSQSSGLPSPKEGMGASRRTSYQGTTPVQGKAGTSFKRNLDVIPGLDYFAIATDILGGQLAGATLRHVHAHILAGLYHGQLGRVMESYTHIKQASYSLLLKMRPSLDKFRRVQAEQTFDPYRHFIKEKTDNQLLIAFWTCLQLESDIIAELPLPQSSILAYEELMPYPNIDLARGYGFDQRVLHSYTAQLYLRKKLNELHSNFYDPQKPQLLDPRQNDFNVIRTLVESLDNHFFPPEFMFDPSEPPARDILSARLRAKYWGAQVIAYRPFIKDVLDFNSEKSTADIMVPGAGDFRRDIAVPVIGPEVKSENDINPVIIQYAEKGIRALIESTRAFHGVEDKRFVITNVFGTAHAQWGNLLTLSAVYRDPTLNKFIDERTLRQLFHRTIQFFRLIAQPSSALSIDMEILEGLNREIWLSRSIDMTDTRAGSSFSSNTSGSHAVPPLTPSAPVPTGMHAPGTPIDPSGHPSLPLHQPM